MARIELKSAEELRWMREAGLVVASIHEALRAAIAPGITTRELDEVSAAAIADSGATSNFLGYYDYPATVCISVNDVIVHGIPGDTELAAGDIVSFDCGAYVDHRGRQWHGDAAFSVIVGDSFLSDEEFASGVRASGSLPGVDDNVLRERRQLDA
ncbi:MAG: M24 family metallopeptidase, partial [Pauljensenia sp.]